MDRHVSTGHETNRGSPAERANRIMAIALAAIILLAAAAIVVATLLS